MQEGCVMASKVEMVTLSKDSAQRVFDALAGSMDFGSGFLESEDVLALRELAQVIGVDPSIGTPDEFKKDFPHKFKEATFNRESLAQRLGLLHQGVRITATGAPMTWNTIDESRMPKGLVCGVGSYSRTCLRGIGDPIHQVKDV
jgi:hypothetical protein